MILWILMILSVIIIMIFTKKKKSVPPIVYGGKPVDVRKPRAIATIKNGSVDDIIMIDRGSAGDHYPWNVVVSGGVLSENGTPAVVKWIVAKNKNKNGKFEITNAGSGYWIPPRIDFLPSIIRTPKTQEEPESQKVSVDIQWGDIPTEQKSEYAELVQTTVREQKYADPQNQLRDLFPEAIVSQENIPKTKQIRYVLEWYSPIELSKVRITFYKIPKNIQLTLIGFNANGVQTFSKLILITSTIVEWNDNFIIKKMYYQGTSKWDQMEILGRRSYWTCEEYADYVDQIKEAVPDSKKKVPVPITDNDKAEEMYEAESADISVYWSDVMNQLPIDMRKNRDQYSKKNKDHYIKYYSRLSKQCQAMTPDQQKAQQEIENANEAEYAQKINEQKAKSKYDLEKMIKEYQKMLAQQKKDQEMIRDAKELGVPPPEPYYTQQEINDLKKRIEMTQSMSSEQLVRHCSKLYKSSNKTRSSAEKWAKASIFLPFLKKKAKREASKAEKKENQYAKQCSGLVELDYEK
jgi:hypothetical protein